VRTLATGNYTHAQVEEQLRAGAGEISWRFEVLNNALVWLFDLPFLDPTDPREDSGVVDVEIENNADRDITGSCRLTMLADDRLRDQMFRRKIRPYLGIGMPDGGTAEFSMGVYVWGKPSRSVPVIGTEEWEITLWDQMHVLAAGGPDLTGFTLPVGALKTDGIKLIYALNGFTDHSRIVPSLSPVPAEMTWTLAELTGKDTARGIMTWADILRMLQDGLGYDPPWFDLSGIPVAEPSPDFPTAPIEFSYTSDKDGLIQGPVEIDNETERIANRVRARATSTGFTAVTDADANRPELAPNHPMAQRHIGYYLDLEVSNSSASNIFDLQVFANRELFDHLGLYEKVRWSSLVHPGHETFDIPGMQITDDPELDPEVKLHHRRWSVNRYGEMGHEASRIIA
jgi:hypothetical protein